VAGGREEHGSGGQCQTMRGVIERQILTRKRGAGVRHPTRILQDSQNLRIRIQIGLE
jgi:hypothetical protein